MQVPSSGVAVTVSCSPCSGQRTRAVPVQPAKPLLIQPAGSGRACAKSQSGRSPTGTLPAGM